MSSLLEQLNKIEGQKKALIEGVLQEIQERIDTLNAAGFRYRLVEESEEQTSRRGGAGRKRPTSEQAFLGKVKAAAFRRWGKISEEKKKELWKREEPLAKRFYGETYKDGVNASGTKYRVQTVPSK
jgi:hypothetical protein